MIDFRPKLRNDCYCYECVNGPVEYVCMNRFRCVITKRIGNHERGMFCPHFRQRPVLRGRNCNQCTSGHPEYADNMLFVCEVTNCTVSSCEGRYCPHFSYNESWKKDLYWDGWKIVNPNESHWRLRRRCFQLDNFGDKETETITGRFVEVRKNFKTTGFPLCDVVVLENRNKKILVYLASGLTKAKQKSISNIEKLTPGTKIKLDAPKLYMRGFDKKDIL